MENTVKCITFTDKLTLGTYNFRIRKKRSYYATRIIRIKKHRGQKCISSRFPIPDAPWTTVAASICACPLRTIPRANARQATKPTARNATVSVHLNIFGYDPAVWPTVDAAVPRMVYLKSRTFLHGPIPYHSLWHYVTVWMICKVRDRYEYNASATSRWSLFNIVSYPFHC